MKRLVSRFLDRTHRLLAPLGIMSYGPNSSQVMRFLQSLKTLTPDQWEHVLAAEAATTVAYGHLDRREIKDAHDHRYGNDRWTSSLLHRFQMSATEENIRRVVVSSTAAWALADCEVMTAKQFAAWYAPFAETIPVESLGPGKAPMVTKPPDTIHERFVLRIQMLELHQWQQIVWIGQSFEEAIGFETINAALRAAADAAESAGVSTETLSAAFATIDGVSEADSAQMLRKVYEGLAVHVGRPAAATGHIRQLDAEVDAYAVLAKRGVLALMARDLITPQQFATLYVPFAGFVRVESLEAKRLW